MAKNWLMVVALFLFTILSGCGLTGNTSHFALPLDVPTKPKPSSEVRVASAAMEPDAPTLVNVGTYAWGKFDEDDLRHIEDSLKYTLAPYFPKTPTDARL